MKSYVILAGSICQDCGVGLQQYLCTKCLLELCDDCAEGHDCESKGGKDGE